MDLRVRLCNGAVLHRSMQRGDVFEVCKVLGNLAQNDLDRFDSRILEVQLVECSHEAKAAHATVFTNICGRITHVPGRQIYQAGVRPFVTRCSDGFGITTNLFSPYCNLSTHEKNTATLFRGATATHEAKTVMDHAICPDAIGSITVHMLVATARLGRNICMHSYFVENSLQQDPRWKAQAIPQLDHMSYMKSVRVSEFAAELHEQLGATPPRAIVLNISKHGCINFFVTMPKDLAFFSGLELAYRPYCELLLSVVKNSS